MEKVNIEQKLSLFSDFGNQRIVGELNGQHVKLVKQKGELSGTSMIMKMNCFM